MKGRGPQRGSNPTDVYMPTKSATICGLFVLKEKPSVQDVAMMTMASSRLRFARQALSDSQYILQVFQAWGKLQVPSIGAWSAEGQRWTLQGECEPKVKFSLAGHVDILGHTWIDHLTFHDGEEFVWTKVRPLIPCSKVHQHLPWHWQRTLHMRQAFCGPARSPL